MYIRLNPSGCRSRNMPLRGFKRYPDAFRPAGICLREYREIISSAHVCVKQNGLSGICPAERDGDICGYADSLTISGSSGRQRSGTTMHLCGRITAGLYILILPTSKSGINILLQESGDIYSRDQINGKCIWFSAQYMQRL